MWCQRTSYRMKETKAAAKKKAPAKKAKALTATDQVLRVIKRSKKGVDAPTLMKKTGFEDKKIRNILMRASKQGKIKRIRICLAPVVGIENSHSADLDQVRSASL